MIVRWGHLKAEGHEQNPTFNLKELKKIADANNYQFQSIKRAYHRHISNFKKPSLSSNLKRIAKICLEKRIYQIKLSGKEILEDFIKL